MNAIKAEKLSLFPPDKRARDTLAEVDLIVPEGSTVALLGGNGAGKSTLIKLLLGLEAIGEGEAYLFERRVPLPESRNGVGYLPEQAVPFAYLTGREQLELFAKLEGLSGSGLSQAVDGAIDRAGISKAADLVTHRYSKGMKQRLELERLLMTPKKLLFLDEPTTGLDIEGQLALEERLLELSQEGVTLVITSHEPQILEKVCSYFAILRKGRLLQFGCRDEILSKRGWSIDFDEGFLPSEAPPSAILLKERNSLLFEKREHAQEYLASHSCAGIKGFACQLKGVEDVLREICSQ